MTTKIPVELSSTPGIVDGSNATAISIDSSERVGIGTPSPDTPLHIKGGADAYVTIEAGAADGNVGFLFDNSSSTQKGALLYDTDDNYLLFNVNSSERMRIDSSGRVNIGHTSSSANGSAAVLSIGNTSGGTINLIDSDDAPTNGGFSQIYGGNQRMYFYTGGSGASSYMQFYTNDTERMRIQSGGGISFNGDSAAANALDDYEEGSWSPAVNGATTTITDAHYVKIGSLVYLNTYLYFSGLPNDGAVFKITGLPYATQPNATYGGGAISYSHAANTADMQPLTQTGDSYIYFHETDGTSNTVTRATAYSKFANGAGYLVLNMTYITNF